MIFEDIFPSFFLKIYAGGALPERERKRREERLSHTHMPPNHHPEDILPTRTLLGKRSPLVLVGAATTAAVLFGGLVSFRSGNFNLSQKMMRYRVLAQGATVGLMVATSGVAFADLGKMDQVWKNIGGGSDASSSSSESGKE